MVVSAIKDWLANGTIAPEINTLATDSAILTFVSTKVQTAVVTTLHLPTALGTVVGNAAADLIRNTLGGSGNAPVRAVIDSVVGTLAPTDQQAAGILAGLSGGDIQPLEDFIGLKLPHAGSGLVSFLSDPNVRSALTSAAADAVSKAFGDGSVRTLVGQQVQQWVSSALGDGSVAQAVGARGQHRGEGLARQCRGRQGLGHGGRLGGRQFP